MSDEIATIKEIQLEAAKAFGGQAAAEVFSFLSDILRPPAKELGGLLSDQVKYFRFKTQFKILKKASEFLQEQGVKPQKVPLRILAPLLEHCSWEEDDDIQKRWATLLANAADPNVTSNNYSTYVEILRQLSPIESKFLDYLYMNDFFAARLQPRSLPRYKSKHSMINVLSINDTQFQIIADNLVRLNLLQYGLKYDTSKLIKNHFDKDVVDKDYSEVSLTYLGLDFIRNCRPRFTQGHKVKIEKILYEYLDSLAKDFNDEIIKELTIKILEIYPMARDDDIQGSLRGAFYHFIWKGEIRPVHDLNEV